MAIHTLMFGWEYPPLHVGGLGVACQGLVGGLLKHGVGVTLVLPHPHGQAGRPDVICPAPGTMFSVRVQSRLQPYAGRSSSGRHGSSSRQMQILYGEDLPHAVSLFSELSVTLTRHIRPDVIHCHDWMTYGAAARAARHHNSPLVVHVHATEMDRTHFRPDTWVFGVEKDAFEKASRIITVSRYTRDMLLRHYGVRAGKIEVVHNGLSEAHLRPRGWERPPRTKTAKPIVLFLGRLTLQKGPTHFLAMARNVHRSCPDAEFIMAGEGDMADQLVRDARRLGLNDRVIFPGRVSASRARELYSHADCFVMPSVSEPFGLVALEAISHGAPVVMSRQSGVSEVVTHALKVDFWDTDGMARCVLAILREPALAERLRTEAPRNISHLQWEQQAKRVHLLYQALVS